jgi:hypothetical protein
VAAAKNADRGRLPVTQSSGSSQPLVTVVIATRNRVPYAISAIRSILQNQDRRLELVIQDNSDSGELEEYVSCHVCDVRLRYRHTGQPLSFIENFNAAIDLSTGEYICAIGDDDGINPEIIEAASWARRHNLDCLAVRCILGYFWPDAGVPSTFFTKVTDSTLTIANRPGSITLTQPERELRALIRNGGLYYLDFDLPRLYHGLVHRRCLQAIQEKTGSFLGGLSPDIFASVALSCVARHVAITDYPLTIPGACKLSGTVVEGALKQHSNKVEDAPHLRDRGDYQWSNLVPRVYMPETIWVDSAAAALTAMGRTDLLNDLNTSRLAAYCIASDRRVMRPVLKNIFNGMKARCESRAIGALRLFMNFLLAPGVKFVHRAVNRFLIIVGKRELCRVHDLRDMIEVTQALTRHLREHGYSFARCIDASNVPTRPAGVGPE